MASGSLLCTFTPRNNEPPSSNYATEDVRNYHPCLDFDDTTNESAVFSGVVPPSYNGGGLDIVLHVAFTSATSGDSDWDVSLELIGTSQDLDSDSFDTAVSVDNTTVPGTSGVTQKITVSLADPGDTDGALSPGDKFRIKVTRDAASDTASGDAELYLVEVYEQ